jgi:hypothetical protein
MGLQCLVRARRFTSLVVTPQGYKSRWSPLHTLASSHIIRHSLLISFPMPIKRERERKRRKEKRKKEWYYQVLGSVASPSLSSHGRRRLDSFQGHTGSPANSHEPKVYDGDGACGLPHARGPCVPRTRGRVCGVLCSILRVGIQCTITSVVPLVARRSLFQHPHAKINEGLTKEVVLPEKRASSLVH